MENIEETSVLPLYDAVIKFITNTEKKSDSNDTSISIRLGVIGRFIAPLNSKTAHLIGMPCEFSDKLTGLDSIDSGFVTILVSPPLSGPYSDYQMWHIYSISSDNQICIKIPCINITN